MKKPVFVKTVARGKCSDALLRTELQPCVDGLLLAEVLERGL